MACGEDHGESRFPKVTSFEQKMINVKCSADMERLERKKKKKQQPNKTIRVMDALTYEYQTVNQLVEKTGLRSTDVNTRVYNLCCYGIAERESPLHCQQQRQRYRLCSRPHSAPQAPIRSMREDEDGHISWQQMNEKALAEHDAAIERKAREKVLDALKAWASTRYKHWPESFDTDRDPYLEVLKEIESLRHHSEQQEQPR